MQSVNALVSTVLAQTGRIDVLVNNAGIGLLGGAEESSISQVQALFDVNLFGVMRVTNAVLPSMRRRGKDASSTSARCSASLPAPYSAHYSATKHALEGYSESLDHEIRAFNIRVSLIEPAYTRSVFEQNALEPDSRLKEYDQARAGARALVRDVMTTADPPEVVADAVLQAATDRAPAATLHRRQGRATGQRAAPVRARRDVRQEPAQADALACLNAAAPRGRQRPAKRYSARPGRPS